jgi:hypothetical protein
LLKTAEIDRERRVAAMEKRRKSIAVGVVGDRRFKLCT